MLTAAAFLETRRYAAYVGATVEFEKFEGVTVNAADKKVCVAMTRMRSGMQDVPADPANDIKLPRNDAGAVYKMTSRAASPTRAVATSRVITSEWRCVRSWWASRYRQISLATRPTWRRSRA